MTAAGQRITALERQVADLEARFENLQRQALVMKTIEEIRANAGPGRYALEAAFAAGRASERGDTPPRPPARRPSHLHAVGGAR
jgi:hypothetical protein